MVARDWDGAAADQHKSVLTGALMFSLNPENKWVGQTDSGRICRLHKKNQCKATLPYLGICHFSLFVNSNLFASRNAMESKLESMSENILYTLSKHKPGQMWQTLFLQKYTLETHVFKFQSCICWVQIESYQLKKHCSL